MQDIVELERRITAAMERITRRVESLATRTPDATPDATLDGAFDGPVGALEEVARLNEALDEERMTNAQLNERLRALRAREGGDDQGQTPDVRVQEATAEIAALKGQLATQTDEIATLRRVLAEAGREIAALRAARTAEAAELAEIISALDPLVSDAGTEAPHA